MYLWSFITPWTVGLYVFLTLFQVVIAIYTSRWLKGTPEINKKYFSFARTDYPYWSYWQSFCIHLCGLSVIRTCLSTSILFVMSVLASCVMIGHKLGDKVPKWRQKAVFYILIPFFRMKLLTCGMIWLDKEQKSDVDYKKYLGPDWKP